MTITPQDISIPVNVATIGETWCVYEHHILPQIIYVGCCALSDLFYLREPRANSDWALILGGDVPANNGDIMVRIIATCDDRTEAMNFAIRHTRSLNPMPRCNVYGFDMHNSRRRVLCSNGQTYDSQAAAARALGITQSAVSRHMKGELAHVRGFKFTYENPAPVAALNAPARALPPPTGDMS